MTKEMFLKIADTIISVAEQRKLLWSVLSNESALHSMLAIPGISLRIKEVDDRANKTITDFICQIQEDQNLDAYNKDKECVEAMKKLTDLCVEATELIEKANNVISNM